MRQDLKHELYHVFSGKSEVRFGTTIQTIASYLNHGSKSSSKIEIEKSFKKQEAKILEGYITEKNLWINHIDFTQYVSEGGVRNFEYY